MKRITQVTTLACTLFAATAFTVTVDIGVAHADNVSKARAQYQRGSKLFAKGKYKSAVRAFQQANRLSPSPVLNYNIALCHDRLGRAEAAIKNYRTYLDGVPNAQNRGAVESSIQRLEATLPAKPIAPPPPPVTRKAPQRVGPTTKPRPPTDESRKPLNVRPPDPPPPVDEGEPRALPPQPPPGPAAYMGTDPELQRVANIDIGRIRDERERTGFRAAPPPVQAPVQQGGQPYPGGPAGPPPPAPRY